MKFFDKIRAAKQRVDPRSQPLIEKIRQLFYKHGVISERTVNECSLQLFWHTLRYFRLVDKGKATPEDKKAFENKMLEVLRKYDITDENEQDALLCDYLNILVEMAEKKG